MKKAFALILVVLMLLAVAGCQTTPGSASDASGSGSGSGSSTGSGSDSSTDSGSGEDSGSADETLSPADYPTITVSSFTALAAPPEQGTTQVEEAINEYLESQGYQFHININIMNWTDYATQLDLSLNSGEPVDVFLSFNLATQVSSGTVLVLDDYFDSELAEAAELFNDQWLACNRYYGHYYGIPTYTCSAETVVYVVRTDILDTIDYDLPEESSLDDLDELFAAVKAEYPNLWCDDAGYYETVMQNLAGKEWGVLSGGAGICADNPTEVVNYYASSTFDDTCALTSRWRAAGYMNPEGSTDQTNMVDYVAAGVSCGMLAANASTPESVADTYSELTGYELDATFVINKALSTGGFTWAIGYSCEHPSEAAQMLNLFYTDETLYNLFVYGIEGVDYVWNADQTEIYYPEGIDAESVPYSYWIGINVMGNRLLGYPFTGYYNAEDVEFLKNRMATVVMAPTFGFTFNTEDLSTQISVLSNVVSQYKDALVHAEIDYDTYFPEFMNALSDAGIDDVVAEAQAQFDAWLAE